MAKKPAPGGNLQELKTQLKNKDLGRLYIFHGEEVFLLHHYLEQMKKQLLDALTESLNFHRMNSETFDLQTFADAVENLPMMAEHTMVQVDEVDLFKLGESDRNKIAEILADIPDYCTVVFTYETTPWKPDKRLKKLWEAIDGAGLIVEFAKQDQKDLAAWVTRHFMARDKRISTDLCLYLIDITGGTMTALSGEIDKICAYSGANEIRKTDIDAVTEPVLDAVVFQMTFPGMPCVFYGDEKGLCGVSESEYRQAMAWGESHPLEDIYRRLIALRKEHPALRYGDFVTNFAAGKTYSYSRNWENTRITVTMNLGGAPIPAPQTGRLLLKKGGNHDIIGAWEYEVREERIHGGDDL